MSTIKIDGVRISAGDRGPQGPAGMNWRNPWSPTQSYAPNDGTSFQGSSYIAIAPNINAQPDVSPLQWQLFAAAGDLSPVAQDAIDNAVSQSAANAAQASAFANGINDFGSITSPATLSYDFGALS